MQSLGKTRANTALPLDMMALSQSPQMPTRSLSSGTQPPQAPRHPRHDPERQRWTLSHRPAEPKKHVYCSSGSYCCVGMAADSAQLSAGSRNDTTAMGRKPNLCPPWESAWLGEARVVCKAQAGGSAPDSESPPHNCSASPLGPSRSAESKLAPHPRGIPVSTPLLPQGPQ